MMCLSQDREFASGLRVGLGALAFQALDFSLFSALRLPSRARSFALAHDG